MGLFRFPPLSRRFFRFSGLFAGAALSALLMQPILLLPKGPFSWLAAALLYGALMGLGFLGGGNLADQTEKRETVTSAACPKVLDTSAIIDGRILDIGRAGFLEGEMVVPSFVLDELRHIADSADALRRARGRRGLDVLKKMQEELVPPPQVMDLPSQDSAEVDVRLLRLARDLGGAAVTNDYNLNKAAAVAGVAVLNINELAGALRSKVLPGEEMTVHLVREGREPGQGVAYLDDGTMVVVENGRSRVGQTLEAEVTTVLQTSAGRMIFARLKENDAQEGA